MRIGLYLPDDKKELYEEAKKRLEKEGRSVSQLFLEALENYMSTPHFTLIKEEIAREFCKLAEELGLSYELNKRVGKIVPEAVINIENKPVAVLTVFQSKYLNITNALEEFSGKLKDIISEYFPVLLSKEIPILITVAITADGSVAKVLFVDVFSLEKREWSPLEEIPSVDDFKKGKKDLIKEAKNAFKNALKLTITNAVRLNRKGNV